MPEDIIYGWHPVLEALKSGRRKLDRIYVAGGILPAREIELQGICRAKGLEPHKVSRQELDRLAGTDKHQGVAVVSQSLPPADIDDLLAEAGRKKELPFLVALDGIEDPHNMGAIIRTAEAAGVHGLVIPARRSAKPGATVAKTSAGASEYLPIATVNNMAQTLDRLKQEGLWAIGLHQQADLIYHKADYLRPLVLVVGGEGPGLHQLVQKRCDMLVAIPQRGRVGSLNASVAAAILIYEVLRQREIAAK